MKRKDFWKRLLFPPLWLMLILVIISAIALPIIFIKGLTAAPISYPFYAAAFYSVCVVSIFCAIVLPKRYQAIRSKLYAHPFSHRYMTDAAFRTRVSLHISLAVNLLYVGVNMLSWFLYRSMWFVVLAVYYMILSVMRFLLVRYVQINALGKNRLGELRRAKLCSSILLLLNFVLTGAVMMILYQNRGFDYHGVLIYVMAAYTFYITTHAIVDLVKYRKYHSPVMTVSKIIALSAALVSMLSLETAMFAQFGGDMAPESKWLMIVLTGAGVSIAVIILSIYMIVRTTQEIRETERNERKNRNL